MSNQTYDLPANLGDIMGAYDTAHWQTVVEEIKAGQGVLKRGTVLASGTGADIGKLVLLTATTEAQAHGALLDPSIDTAAALSNGSVTGSIAKAGSSKGSALIVPPGVDAGLIAVSLRGRGIFVEGRSLFLLLLLSRSRSLQRLEVACSHDRGRTQLQGGRGRAR